MKPYRLCFFRTQNLVGRQDFQAEDSMTARFIAVVIYDACSDVCDSFELWENAYRIDAPLHVTADILTLSRQREIAATETALVESRWAIAKSRGLLARLEAMKRNLVRS